MVTSYIVATNSDIMSDKEIIVVVPSSFHTDLESKLRTMDTYFRE